jgi:hypothetical protein
MTSKFQAINRGRGRDLETYDSRRCSWFAIYRGSREYLLLTGSSLFIYRVKLFWMLQDFRLFGVCVHLDLLYLCGYRVAAPLAES